MYIASFSPFNNYFFFHNIPFLLAHMLVCYNFFCVAEVCKADGLNNQLPTEGRGKEGKRKKEVGEGWKER